MDGNGQQWTGMGGNEWKWTGMTRLDRNDKNGHE